MKALILGAAGFVGGYLAEYLKKEGWTVFATKMKQETSQMDQVAVYDLDLLDAEAVRVLLDRIKPDAIFHLAAQSSVACSWKKPVLTFDVNVKGCIHLLEAVRELEDKLKKKIRILIIGSSEEYGAVKEEEPVKEEHPLCPRNLYAATKVCQNMVGKIYADAYQMEIVLVRAFNHIGPKQASTFVVADFCRQVAEIEAGKREAVMQVGNLSARRDFTDVRDIVHAYGMLIQKGRAGETYNVGSGTAVAVQEILEKILSFAKKEIRVELDPKKLRPVDVPVVEADIQKIREEIGWERQISLVDTLEETLNYWRIFVRQQEAKN